MIAKIVHSERVRLMKFKVVNVVGTFESMDKLNPEL